MADNYGDSKVMKDTFNSPLMVLYSVTNWRRFKNNISKNAQIQLTVNTSGQLLYLPPQLVIF